LELQLTDNDERKTFCSDAWRFSGGFTLAAAEAFFVMLLRPVWPDPFEGCVKLLHKSMLKRDFHRTVKVDPASVRQ